MEDILNKLIQKPDEAPKLYDTSTFNFDCHKGVPCFNKCCGELEVFLSPLDILRIKNRLETTSSHFLNEYADIVIPETTLIPFVKLKLGEGGKCRFVSDEGCTIYEDRPLACRYYPLGFGALVNVRQKGEQFYFLIREEHCKGFEQGKEWKVSEWKADQGINEYEDANKDWVDIILHKKLKSGSVEPDEKSMNMFFMGSYDVDAFRDFVLGSRFLDVFELDEELLDLIKSNEVELLKFAHRWLKYALFKEPLIGVSLKE